MISGVVEGGTVTVSFHPIRLLANKQALIISLKNEWNDSRPFSPRLCLAIIVLALRARKL